LRGKRLEFVCPSSFFILHSSFAMKLGTVIGRVTLSRSEKTLTGGRFLIVSPFSREQYAKRLDAGAGMGKDPSLVVYDDLGGGVGDVIGYEEGAEAAQPMPQPTPIDAINCALIDEMFYSPWKG
jgi:ethanolamine utilization protein EutN